MTDKPKPTPIGLNEIAEDAFGLSLRGFRTMWIALRKPQRVFDAARSLDWLGGRFTPSVRLVFSILAVMTALRFLWAGEQSVLYGMVDLAVGSANAFSEHMAHEEFVESLLDHFVFFFPLTYMALHVLAVLGLRIWGRGTGYALRLRLHFVALIPSTLFTLIGTPAFSAFSAESWRIIGPVFMVALLAIDFTTVMRGGAAGAGTFGKVWRSGLFALVNFVISFITNTLAIMLAQIWMMTTIELSAAS
ncbi:hypothetical protein [Ponticaulis profundi]|uniref:Yip1 domain-containing protein n=1 Tax=Ponticaulis profundi TaxID=2665222 RepID=A0ABW1SAG5_9PROT